MHQGPTFTVRLTPTETGPAAGSAARPFFRRRRNRHGRGMRGELIPAHLPGSMTRSEQFDEWVMESAQRIERLWGDRIRAVQFMVDDIPDGLEELVAAGAKVPLGKFAPGRPGRPATVTVYRHPVQMAAQDFIPVNELVHDVVIEQVAELLGVSPEAVDPSYGRSRF